MALHKDSDHMTGGTNSPANQDPFIMKGSGSKGGAQPSMQGGTNSPADQDHNIMKGGGSKGGAQSSMTESPNK